MSDRSETSEHSIPARAGVGLKPEHWEQILSERPGLGWFEIHAENYMEAGGPPHYFLGEIRSHYPLSVHGVGLSIGSAGPLDRQHLLRLKAVCDRYQPGLVSEHLAWSTHEGTFLNDLLPLPYTRSTLDQVCRHIDEAQTVLARTILLENPSTYVRFASSEMSEIEFLSTIAKRTGCKLLLDVNNVYVSATNHAYSPENYIDEFPIHLVGEIHLGGHSPDLGDAAEPLLIDAHGCAVADPVWMLYARIVARAGAIPTLIEWDNDVPPLRTLLAEAKRAEGFLSQRMRNDARAA